MSATKTVSDRSGEAPDARPRPQPRRRRWTSRLSMGHGLMLGAGLLAALLNLALLRGGDETVLVAVAAADIQPGERLTSNHFGETELAAGSAIISQLIPSDQVDDLVGLIASARIAAGEPVLRSAVSPGAGGRAMSVPVDPEHAVGGRLRVGDRIDVIEVQEDRATYVATDLEIIGINESGSGGALDGLGSYSVTVAVDDATALRLAAAIRADRFELVRSTGAEPPAESEHVFEREASTTRSPSSEDAPSTDDEGT